MITPYKIKFTVVISMLLIAVIAVPQKSFAQRFNHPTMNAPVSHAAPAFTHQAPAMNNPAPRPTAVSHPAMQTPVNRTINGGSRNNGNHNFNGFNHTASASPHPMPAVQKPATTMPRPSHPAANGNPTVSIHESNITRNNNRNNNNIHRGVNVHENANVYHTNNVPYHPYSYHPYQPYHWGASWHPIGFVAASLAADAFLFSFSNQQYYYDDGVYYQPEAGGYAVVPAPIGSIVSSLPDGYETVQVGDDNFYYYGGTFYIDIDQGYQVVAAPYGAVVTDIPDGATEQDINGQSILVYNNTYYQPVSQDGEDAYEVVQGN